jgi:hypothetical protein
MFSCRKKRPLENYGCANQFGRTCRRPVCSFRIRFPRQAAFKQDTLPGALCVVNLIVKETACTSHLRQHEGTGIERNRKLKILKAIYLEFFSKFEYVHLSEHTQRHAQNDLNTYYYETFYLAFYYLYRCHLLNIQYVCATS